MAITTKQKIWDAILHIKDSPRMGIIYAVSSTVFFSLSDFAAQQVIHSRKDFPIFEMAFVRSIVQVVLMVPFVLMLKSRVLFGPEQWLHLFLMSFVGYFLFVLVYLALNFIPVSIVLPISATCPMFATVFSYFILKEKCLLLDALCGTIGLLGVIVIARPTFIFGKYGNKNDVFNHVSSSKYEINYLEGCTFALLFGIGKALMITLMRKWARDSTETKSDQTPTVLYPSILGCTLTPALMLFTGKKLVLPNGTDETCYLFVVGILTLMGSFSNAMAMKTQTAPAVGIIRNLDIVWGFLLQYMLMHIWPSMWSVGGSVIIICTTIMVCFREKAGQIGNCCCQPKYEECNMVDEDENSNTGK